MQFSHIYIENDALPYPLTTRIKNYFKSAQIVDIQNYKQFFNRSRQDFVLQRTSPKLILAVQKNNFLEEGTQRVQSFGKNRVFSASLVRNCMYHCDYCFLQGMHQSANIVIYVNTDDFKEKIHSLAKNIPNEKIYLTASYVSDILAFEHFIGACDLFIQMVKGLSNVTLEIRTKSDGFINLQNVTPQENVVLVFSISPQQIVRTYEHGTASFFTRVLHSKMAIDKGWRVRLCFDPILYFDGWKQVYKQTLHDIFDKVVDVQKIEMVSYGVFRMGQSFLSKMRTARPHVSVLQTYIQISDGLGTYSKGVVSEIKHEFADMLKKYINEKKIHFVHG